MILSIKDKMTLDIFDGTDSRYSRKLPVNLHDKASRLLDMLNAASTLADLQALPGNKLEQLKGTLKDFHSIRINNQWRIIFIWHDTDAADVQITDYH